MASGDNAGFQRGKNAFARMTPEQRAENGRKGAEKANENRRKRKEMRETLDILLNMQKKVKHIQRKILNVLQILKVKT